MKFDLINTVEQFEQIKKGDLLLVKWSDNFLKHTQMAKKVMLYTIYENKYTDFEIICQKKDNHYFNYMMQLSGLSSALEVYKVIDN